MKKQIKNKNNKKKNQNNHNNHNNQNETNIIKEKYEPGHFYSVIPHVFSNYNEDNKVKFDNIDYNENSHIQILSDLPHYLGEYDNEFTKNFDLNNRHNTILENQQNFRYTLVNGSFEWMDGRMLYYFIQKNKPKRIIEIGSGNSTLLMYNTIQKFNLDTKITCIEPYPIKFLDDLHNMGKINLMKEKLENVSLDVFKTLEENDILFIDSSHVGKLNSDVLYYFTKIFPVLNKNVLIHIHDIFFPYEYPGDWIREGRFWNEQYFLYTFLQYNSKFKVKYCNSYTGYKYKNELIELQKNTFEIKNNLANQFYTGGSIWLTVEN